MPRTMALLATAVLLFAQSVHSQESDSTSPAATKPTGGDHRQLVSMPEQARELMRQDMLLHLSTLNEIMGYLADNDLKAAAEAAETKMGKSSMGKHRATGMGPGRFMPLEMRNMGWGMHEAATEFSQIAREGDMKRTYGALQKVTTFCIACHYSYRTR